MIKDRPTEASARSDGPTWGSDVVAGTVRRLGYRYLALNPGASFRGLHDSVVNYLGNEGPAMLLCLHEEHAVAIAHGYAKVSGEPMAVALHSNVGLMHASMAMFNAWCDRVPMLIIGATGPVDAVLRRPWIDWIHTSSDQAALVRAYVKWDDQPASVGASVASLVQADLVTRTYPSGPTYVVLDSSVQEEKLTDTVQLPDPNRYRPPVPLPPAPAQIAEIAAILESSERTVLMFGRVGRGEEAWGQRIALAERLGASVVSDIKAGVVFPTDHRLQHCAPSALLSQETAELLRTATAIISFDWIDLGGTLRATFGDQAAPVPVVHCSMDHVLHNGANKEHFQIPTCDLFVATHPDELIQALLADGVMWAEGSALPEHRRELLPTPIREGPLTIRHLSHAVYRALSGSSHCLVRIPIGWHGADLRVTEPFEHLGADGGAGIGSGPGMTVGAALALSGSDRLAIGVLGDGDTLMGLSALWTAAHYQLPLLIVVANNRSFFNDEIHQERVARQRGRPAENRWVGQRIDDPAPDIPALARALGLVAYGPVEDHDDLDAVLAGAISEARAGAAVLVDVSIAAAPYQV